MQWQAMAGKYTLYSNTKYGALLSSLRRTAVGAMPSRARRIT